MASNASPMNLNTLPPWSLASARAASKNWFK
jgi:hypothetical protein